MESRAKADALAKKRLLKDDYIFWKDVKRMSSTGNNVLQNMVDNVVGEQAVADMWSEH